MSNYLNETVSDLTVFHSIDSAMQIEQYYGYLSVKKYNPHDVSQRAGASKAFAYWFLKNCTRFDFSKLRIKDFIVDCTNDQGVDVAFGTSKNWEEDGCQDIWLYQFKFYESNIDDDAVDKMKELWDNVKKGENGFSGDVKAKLDELEIFDYLKNPGVKVHFIMVITTELDSSAKVKWNRLSQDLRFSSSNYYLTLYDKNYLSQYV